MKRTCFAIGLLALLPLFADMGQETITSVDLSRRPLNGLSWSWTEYCDSSVRLVANKNGDEFCTTNWTCYLVIGGGSSGCVYEGIQRGYNETVFNVDASSLPTNGRYTVQIVGTQGRRSEEWARGYVRVNLSPAVEYMPTCWMGYQKVARLAALYVTWDDLMTSTENRAELTNTVMTVYGELDIGEYVSDFTNPCVRVAKSNVAELPRWSELVRNDNDNAPPTYVNSAISNVYFVKYGATLADGWLFVGQETFTPTNVNSVLFFTACPTNTDRFVRLIEGNVSDAAKRRAVYGEE